MFLLVHQWPDWQNSGHGLSLSKAGGVPPAFQGWVLPFVLRNGKNFQKSHPEKGGEVWQLPHCGPHTPLPSSSEPIVVGQWHLSCPPIIHHP